MPADLELTTLTAQLGRQVRLVTRTDECDHTMLVAELLAVDER